jgi:hypothetical protein
MRRWALATAPLVCCPFCVQSLAMCNLYNITTSQQAVCEMTRTLSDLSGNLPPSIDINPNRAATTFPG